MSNVGNGQLNEYWGFSGLEIDADIPTSTGCPGSNCSVGSCVKWPAVLKRQSAMATVIASNNAAIKFIHPKVIRRVKRRNWQIKIARVCQPPHGSVWYHTDSANSAMRTFGVVG